MKPRVLVLRAAGTNCEAETAHAFERFGARTETMHVNRLIRKPAAGAAPTLAEIDALALPGGFSYGDDVGAGKVLAVELLLHLKDQILALVDRGGLVLGICNGFQTLVKTGVLPGISARIGVQEATLIDNDSNRYEDRWVVLESVSKRSVVLEPGIRIEVPVAHGEGRYVPKDETVRRAVLANDHVAFRYVARDPGSEGSIAGYPDNPNGSVDAVAGLVDTSGRVLGLMPHPERALFTVLHPDRHGVAGAATDDLGDGARIFQNAVRYLAG